MKSKVGAIVSFLLVALVLSALYLGGAGCGGGEESGTRTITMGFLTDMTGPASSFLVKTDAVYSDLADYINNNDPIPGVKIEIAWYDTQYNPSRDILGYEYLKDKGAAVVFSGIPTVGDSLKTQVARDQMVLVSSAPSTYQLVPPGWVLCQTPPIGWVMKGFLKWIAENDWDYQAQGRIPRIGAVGWEEPYHKDVTAAMEEYVSEHTDQFQWVAGPVAPMNTMSWYGEVEQLKDCDYIYLPSTGVGIPTFVNEYRAKGYKAKFLGLDAMAAFTELIVDSTGWQALDGTLTAHTTPYWTDQSPIVDACKQLLQAYHTSDKDSIVSSGLGYISEYFCAQVQFELLRHAVEKVGAANFDSKAYLEASADFTWNADGIPSRGYGFSATQLYARKDFRVYKWSAQSQQLTAVSDWEPDWEPS